jgi:hypothetical protein
MIETTIEQIGKRADQLVARKAYAAFSFPLSARLFAGKAETDPWDLSRFQTVYTEHRQRCFNYSLAFVTGVTQFRLLGEESTCGSSY